MGKLRFCSSAICDHGHLPWSLGAPALTQTDESEHEEHGSNNKNSPCYKRLTKQSYYPNFELRMQQLSPLQEKTTLRGILPCSAPLEHHRITTNEFSKGSTPSWLEIWRVKKMCNWVMLMRCRCRCRWNSVTPVHFYARGPFSVGNSGMSETFPAFSRHQEHPPPLQSSKGMNTSLPRARC